MRVAEFGGLPGTASALACASIWRSTGHHMPLRIRYARLSRVRVSELPSEWPPVSVATRMAARFRRGRGSLDWLVDGDAVDLRPTIAAPVVSASERACGVEIQHQASPRPSGIDGQQTGLFRPRCVPVRYHAHRRISSGRPPAASRPPSAELSGTGRSEHRPALARPPPPLARHDATAAHLFT